MLMQKRSSKKKDSKIYLDLHSIWINGDQDYFGINGEEDILHVARKGKKETLEF